MDYREEITVKKLWVQLKGLWFIFFGFYLSIVTLAFFPLVVKVVQPITESTHNWFDTVLVNVFPLGELFFGISLSVILGYKGYLILKSTDPKKKEAVK